MGISATYSASEGVFHGAAQALKPSRSAWDLFGLFSGLRAYRIYSELSDMPDAELARRGLAREDLARVAAKAAGL